MRHAHVGEGAKLYLEGGVGLSSVGLRIEGERSNFNAITLPVSLLEQRWYVVYTRANHEKRVAAELHARAVEHFLPLHTSVRRWRDRRVVLGLPLFPGYVFVRLALCDRLRVLEIPSVVRLVGFDGRPYELCDEEMETLRVGLRFLRAEPHPFITVGRRVEIKRGPLAGLEGILVRKKGRPRVVLSIDGIMRSIAVEVAVEDLF